VVSTLKLTKIQIPNSDSDVLSFNSSTGVMTFHKDIQGEGTATTNLQQGLAKCWVNFDGTGTIASRDSFNIASLTDTGTGHYDPNFSNNMSNNDYSATGGISESGVGGEATIVLGDGYTTSSVKVLTRNSTSATDYLFVACTVNGDLA